MENNFSIDKGYHGDPSMPNFKFMGPDREKKIAELKAEGVPDDQIEKAIEMAEAVITNKQAQAALDREMQKS